MGYSLMMIPEWCRLPEKLALTSENEQHNKALTQRRGIKTFLSPLKWFSQMNTAKQTTRETDQLQVSFPVACLMV